MSKRADILSDELRDVRDGRNRARGAFTKANIEFWELAKLLAPDLAKEIREQSNGVFYTSGWGDQDSYTRSALIKAARERQWKNATNTQKLDMLYRENHG